jgi:mono/diheme cytochrome c family protein
LSCGRFDRRWRIGRAILTIAILATIPAPGVAEAGEVVDYVRQVKPILKQRCYSCHGVLKQKAGLRLDTAASIRKGGGSGPAVEPASPDESELIGRVAETDSKRRMPPEGEPLSAEQVSRLREWVVQGANAPQDEAPEEDSRRHWAFLKPVRPAVPKVKNAGWVRNPIDAFLAAEHEHRGLTPLSPAAPEVLMRRVYLDLTGLPPTREELRAFLQDPSETRYEDVVERLLASPAYGERWARHWMDVWRYSDWYGRRAVPDVTNSYAMLWRWRDWIVRSLNEDKGYDRMVAEMLAADELCPADDANVVATGFVLRNFYRWNYNTWMRDNVEHTAKAFLGLTIQCAHCHDHTYDPITQEDYFAFRAIFEPLEVRHDRVPGEPDPGPFPKYVYGSAYKPITSGMARVVDAQLDAKTFLYTRGESRNVVPGKAPIPPGVPAFLGGSFRVEPVPLPATAYYPGLKPFVQQEELQKAEKALAEAELAAVVARRKQEETGTALDRVARAWDDRSSPPAFSGRDDVRAFRDPLGPVPPDVQGARDASENAELAYRLAVERSALARARLESVKARISADIATFGERSDDFEGLRLAASRAERAVEVAQARVNLAVTAKMLGAARRKARTDPKAATEVAKAEEQRASALNSSAGVPAKESKAYSPLSPVYPKESTGRRKALALWITSRDNPLTARVAVNHVWRWHFHQPLVASTFDFGRNGKRPANPPLLDWLAVELMEPGTPRAKPWDLKSLHRLMVTSAAYRMSSHASDPDHPNRALDKENLAYWHFPASRIESEVVRDSLLHASGLLDRAIGGPDIPYDQGLTSFRRSLYFTHHGEARMPFLELFDAPDACDAYTRTVSVVPQQALALTNSQLARSLSRDLATRLGREAGADKSGDNAFVTAAFEQVLGRSPSPRERDVSCAFLARQAEKPTAESVARSRESLVQALFNHNDFLTVH